MDSYEDNKLICREIQNIRVWSNLFCVYYKKIHDEDDNNKLMLYKLFYSGKNVFCDMITIQQNFVDIVISNDMKLMYVINENNFIIYSINNQNKLNLSFIKKIELKISKKQLYFNNNRSIIISDKIYVCENNKIKIIETNISGKYSVNSDNSILCYCDDEINVYNFNNETLYHYDILQNINKNDFIIDETGNFTSHIIPDKNLLSITNFKNKCFLNTDLSSFGKILLDTMFYSDDILIVSGHSIENNVIYLFLVVNDKIIKKKVRINEHIEHLFVNSLLKIYVLISEKSILIYSLDIICENVLIDYKISRQIEYVKHKYTNISTGFLDNLLQFVIKNKDESISVSNISRIEKFKIPKYLNSIIESGYIITNTQYTDINIVAIEKIISIFNNPKLLNTLDKNEINLVKENFEYFKKSMNSDGQKLVDLFVKKINLLYV